MQLITNYFYVVKSTIKDPSFLSQSGKKRGSSTEREAGQTCVGLLYKINFKKLFAGYFFIFPFYRASPAQVLIIGCIFTVPSGIDSKLFDFSRLQKSLLT